MKNIFSLLTALMFVLGIIIYDSNNLAQALMVDWANEVSASNTSTAENALGRPDGVFAGFYDANAATIETATYTDFHGGDNIFYDNGTFATMLGISEELLIQADFISFELNGAAGTTYESSDWVFRDGINSLMVAHTSGSSVGGPTIALGNMSFSSYNDLFGLNYSYPFGDIAYILFDIDGFSDVNPFSNSFSVTLNAVGSSVAAADHPESDVMGLIATPVPEPSTLLLLVLGVLGISISKWKFGRANNKISTDNIYLQTA